MSLILNIILHLLFNLFWFSQYISHIRYDTMKIFHQDLLLTYFSRLIFLSNSTVF